MNYPVWSLADKSQFTAEAPLKSLRIIQVYSTRYFVLFPTREKADEFIAMDDIPDATVPLLIPDNVSFKEALDYAKSRNAKQGIKNPHKEGDKLQGDLFDIV